MTDEYCITHATPNLRVILSGAAPPVQRQAQKPTIAAQSNPEGAPAGGISALV